MSTRHSFTKLAVFIMGVAALVTLRPADVGGAGPHDHDAGDGKAWRRADQGRALRRTERIPGRGSREGRGCVLQFGCVSGSDSGAMGMHFVNGALVW